MTIRTKLSKLYFNHIHPHSRTGMVRAAVQVAKSVEHECLSLKYQAAQTFPNVLSPSVSFVKVSLTSNCNLRCKGCLYGRLFLPRHHIDVKTMMAALDDMAALGVPRVEFYGGEPLLYPEIAKLISHARQIGLTPSLGTNATLLDEEVVDALVQSGLKAMCVGVYGVGGDYDDYVSRPGSFAKVERNLAYVRSQHPEVDIGLSWLLMRPTCSVDAVTGIWEFSRRLDVQFVPILIHYEFPYFSNGDDGELQLYEVDRPKLDEVTKLLLLLKSQEPRRIAASVEGLAAIPDWLIKKGDNEIPCFLEDSVWILPNGDLHACARRERIGNINEARFKDIVHTEHHAREVQDCLHLNCTGCHLRHDTRTTLHRPSRRHYAGVARSIQRNS